MHLWTIVERTLADMFWSSEDTHTQSSCVHVPTKTNDTVHEKVSVIICSFIRDKQPANTVKCTFVHIWEQNAPGSTSFCWSIHPQSLFFSCFSSTFCPCVLCALSSPLIFSHLWYSPLIWSFHPYLWGALKTLHSALYAAERNQCGDESTVAAEANLWTQSSEFYNICFRSTGGMSCPRPRPHSVGEFVCEKVRQTWWMSGRERIYSLATLTTAKSQTHTPMNTYRGM